MKIRLILAIFFLTAQLSWATEICGRITCTGQLDVGTTIPVKIGDAANRFSLTIHDWDGTNPMFCGPSASVASTTGARVEAGIARTFGAGYPALPTASDDIWCIATGAQVHMDYVSGRRP